jgi:hypothetical protein
MVQALVDTEAEAVADGLGRSDLYPQFSFLTKKVAASEKADLRLA